MAIDDRASGRRDGAASPWRSRATVIVAVVLAACVFGATVSVGVVAFVRSAETEHRWLADELADRTAPDTNDGHAQRELYDVPGAPVGTYQSDRELTDALNDGGFAPGLLESTLASNGHITVTLRVLLSTLDQAECGAVARAVLSEAVRVGVPAYSVSVVAHGGKQICDGFDVLPMEKR